MLHTTKLLVVGTIRAVVDDLVAIDELRCGDKDAAFALIAQSNEDVFAFLNAEGFGEKLPSADTPPAPHSPHSTWDDSDDDEDDDEDFDPVRFYFFCRNEDDRHWLHGACFAQPEGLGLASIEICPATGTGVCLLRVPRGVRTIPILTAE